MVPRCDGFGLYRVAGTGVTGCAATCETRGTLCDVNECVRRSRPRCCYRLAGAAPQPTAAWSQQRVRRGNLPPPRLRRLEAQAPARRPRARARPALQLVAAQRTRVPVQRPTRRVRAPARAVVAQLRAALPQPAVAPQRAVMRARVSAPLAQARRARARQLAAAPVQLLQRPMSAIASASWTSCSSTSTR